MFPTFTACRPLKLAIRLKSLWNERLQRSHHPLVPVKVRDGYNLSYCRVYEPKFIDAQIRFVSMPFHLHLCKKDINSFKFVRIINETHCIYTNIYMEIGKEILPSIINSGQI